MKLRWKGHIKGVEKVDATAKFIEWRAVCAGSGTSEKTGAHVMLTDHCPCAVAFFLD